MQPYHQIDGITIYHGPAHHVLRALWAADQKVHAVVTDPPYGVTAHPWDQWVHGWPDAIRSVTSSLWCFGTMRMFLKHHAEFRNWQFSQDLIWRKPRMTNMANDRFARCHEMLCFWYRGPWTDLFHETPREEHHGPRMNATTGGRVPHWLGQPEPDREWTDDGTRLARSVIDAPSIRNGVNETEKPLAVLDQPIRYSVPPGGTVLDLFAGSGSVGDAARAAGRQAILIDIRESQCEAMARRFSQTALTL